MIGVKYDYAKDVMKQIWDEREGKKKQGAGNPIPRTRRKNIEKAKKESSEVKGNE
jgi:hypothetical protein